MKTKVIITNDIIEVMTYQKLNTNTPKEGIQDGIGVYREENYQKTQKARRNKIRRLVAANFNQKDRFITLTFNNNQKIDISNPKETNKLFNLFVKRLKYQYPKIKGVAVIEYQDKNERGAVHYHMVMNGIKYITPKQLELIWSHGYVQIKSIKHVDNVGAYLIKYMNKDIGDTRLMDKKAYLKFGELTEPQELKSWKHQDIEKLRQLDLKLHKKTPTYASTYESKTAGIITYSQYNLNRNT